MLVGTSCWVGRRPERTPNPTQGTLLVALGREELFDPDAIRADVEGVNEIRDKIPVLTRIEIRLRIARAEGVA